MLHQEIPLTSHKYGIGISWDQTGKQAVDVDLQAVVVDDKGTIIDAVYYNNLKALKSITHSGDEVGERQGLAEVIWVMMNKLPMRVKLILFVVAAYSGGHLRNAKNGFIHVLEDRKDNEVRRVPMEQSDFNVDAVAMMVKSDDGSWKLGIIEEPAQEGQHFIDILEPTLGNIIRSQIPGAPARQKVAFAMEKGTVVDLPESTSLGQICAGLGWDVADELEMDLDVSAVCFSGAPKCVGAIFFGNMEEYGLMHSGDNLTGEGEGDDEVIIANLEAIPELVQQIFFVVNIYTNGVSFEQVKDAYCRIFDRTGAEFARYILKEGRGKRGLIIARLFREPGNRWGFQALGQFCRGKTWKDALDDVAPLVRASAQELQLRGASTVDLGGGHGTGSVTFGSELSERSVARTNTAPIGWGAAKPPPPKPVKSSLCAIS